MFFYLCKKQIKARIQYGRALLYDIIAGMLIFLLDITPILAIVQIFKFPNNWSSSDIVLLYTFARVGRIFGDLFFWVPMFEMERAIQQGTLDRYLLAPIDSFVYYIGQNFSTFTMGHCFMSVIVAFITIFHMYSEISLASIACSFLTFIGGSLIYAALLIFCGGIAFWTKASSVIFQIISSITRFSNYPLSFYPRIIRYVLVFVIPLAITSYYPTAILLNKVKYSLLISIFVFLCGATMFLLAYQFWWIGVRFYQGTGSAGSNS